MKFLWEECGAGGERGARILRVLGDDGEVELPESIESGGGRLPVTELGDYAFSAMMREEPERDGIPAMCGNRLRSAALPSGLKKIGRYAFYNCEKLESLALPSSVLDLGAGPFTGCRGIKNLDVRLIPEEKSCLAELLSELNQELRVTLRDEGGRIQARLLIPEYFEESVENTPARILFVETHGCGHRYRYCFRQGQSLFSEYDALFPHVRVQEKPETAAELAWYRLRWPVGLAEKSREIYLDYLREYPEEAMAAFGRIGEGRFLRRTLSEPRFDGEAVSRMILAAGESGQSSLVPVLMDVRREKREGAEKKGGGPDPAAEGRGTEKLKKKRKFEL